MTICVFKRVVGVFLIFVISQFSAFSAQADEQAGNAWDESVTFVTEEDVAYIEPAAGNQVGFDVVDDVPLTPEQQALRDLRFSEDGWDKALLSRLEAGPRILERGLDFGMPPPPFNDSAYTKKELKLLHVLAETKRTEENKKRIVYENILQPVWNIFIKEGLLDTENYKTLDLLKMIDLDHGYYILALKKEFARPRPNQIDPSLETYIPNPFHPAYPSGHASQAMMIALVLSDFDPDNAAVYKEFAYDIAHRREIAGVHYSSDSAVGRQLAVDVLARLRKNEVFEKKYQEAKESYIPPVIEKNTVIDADAWDVQADDHQGDVSPDTDTGTDEGRSE